MNIPWSQTGAAQNTQAKAHGLSLNRIEDGHWDPNHPNDYYFVTTEGGDKTAPVSIARDGGGLWRLRFADIENPAAGATLTLLLDGSESLGATEPKFNKPDNMTIDRHGNLLIQEDPGGNDHVARIVAYRLSGRGARRRGPLRRGPLRPGATRRPGVPDDRRGVERHRRCRAASRDGTFLFDAQVHTAKGLPPAPGPARSRSSSSAGSSCS